MKPLAPQLAAGLEQMSLSMDQKQQQQCLNFLELILKWNEKINLTAITDPEEMLVKHLFDSLSISSYLQGPRILDVGTGGGLPGIPLAILHPELQFVLIDKVQKKTRFVTQAAYELGLSNVTVETGLVENYQPAECFNTVLSRAVSSLRELVHTTQHLCCNAGRWLAMKAQHYQDELTEMSQAVEVIDLSVPGLQQTRTLLRVIKGTHHG